MWTDGQQARPRGADHGARQDRRKPRALADGVIPTCPVCGRPLALGDRSGRHVASEAHYPRLAASGVMVCSPPARDVVQLGIRGGSRRAQLRIVNDRDDLKEPPADEER